MIAKLCGRGGVRAVIAESQADKEKFVGLGSRGLHLDYGMTRAVCAAVPPLRDILLTCTRSRF